LLGKDGSIKKTNVEEKDDTEGDKKQGEGDKKQATDEGEHDDSESHGEKQKKGLGAKIKKVVHIGQK